jgi:hypothetical protein
MFNLFNISFTAGVVKAVSNLLWSYIDDNILMETGDSLLLEQGGLFLREQDADTQTGNLLQSNGDLILLP